MTRVTKTVQSFADANLITEVERYGLRRPAFSRESNPGLWSIWEAHALDAVLVARMHGDLKIAQRKADQFCGQPLEAA